MNSYAQPQQYCSWVRRIALLHSIMPCVLSRGTWRISLMLDISKKLSHRDSNPGHPRDRRACYHCTMEDVIQSQYCLNPHIPQYTIHKHFIAFPPSSFCCLALSKPPLPIPTYVSFDSLTDIKKQNHRAGTKEWRQPTRPARQMRHVDEPTPQKRHSRESRRKLRVHQRMLSKGIIDQARQAGVKDLATAKGRLALACQSKLL